MNSTGKAIGLLFLILSLSSACSTMDISAARQDFREYIQGCKQRFNYDPLQTEGLGDYQLAEGEKEFLNCVYTGLNDLLIPNTTIPEDYEKLVKDHRDMTQKVADKEMTRSERMQRSLAAINSIKEHEAEEKDKRIQQFQRISDEMRRQEEMNRIQNITTQVAQARNFSALSGALGR